MKKFATSLLIYAGPLAYNFLQQNMPEALPCIRTIQNLIYSEYHPIQEEEEHRLIRDYEHENCHNVTNTPLLYLL